MFFTSYSEMESDIKSLIFSYLGWKASKLFEKEHSNFETAKGQS